MLGLNPISISREKSLSKEEIAQALRWATIAELDAITFYEQFARLIEDENIKKVFLDVAKEEKAHVGEFMALLLNLDSEQLSELKEGFEEVEELTGIKTELNPSEEKEVRSGYIEVLKKALIEVISKGRIIVSSLPKTKIIGMQSFRVDLIRYEDGVKVTKQEYKPIPMLTKKFYIGLRELDDGTYDPAIAVKAGELLVKNEEELIINELLSTEGIKRGTLRSWENTEEALDDLMNALQEASKASAGPFGIILNPKRYAKLLRVHEKGGRILIEVLKNVFKGGILVTPNISEDKVVVFANTPAVMDIVIGQDVELKELGPEGDAVAFLVGEALALRVKSPEAIVILE
ncbi:encapsulin [Thermococcus argininiproducens]|uniref:Encapsulin n=1 Tax=Thermococcus argininiproducens TaxID=2866384 RepID=A0A9E7MCE7_9EURY|nr:family 1 encapsulin nanocompartment shell protein [Thermococcus argininiproducens]USH00843.1 encapsulin [Thermococcus argininiproducens]